MTGSENPVENGLIVSLSHPGGNSHRTYPQRGSRDRRKSLAIIERGGSADLPRCDTHKRKLDNNPYIDSQRKVGEDLNITLLVHSLNDVQSAADYDAILASMIAARADALFVFPEFIIHKYPDAFGAVYINDLPGTYYVSKSYLC